MSSRDPEKLIEPFRTQIKELIRIAKEKGLRAFITDTTRTKAEQQKLVDAGLSRTMHSKHLLGEAADIAFKDSKGNLIYDAGLYEKLYKIARVLPFVRWPFKDYKWNWDYPHFQYDKLKTMGYNALMKLSDFIVDGMPADNRIKALKDQVKRLLGDVVRWKNERFKWYGIANEHKRRADNSETALGIMKDELERKEEVIQDLNTENADLEGQALTPHQREGLTLLGSLKAWLQK